jgi:hypothetical protein
MDRFVQRTHRTEDSAVQALLALVEKKNKKEDQVLRRLKRKRDSPWLDWSEGRKRSTAEWLKKDGYKALQLELGPECPPRCSSPPPFLPPPPPQEHNQGLAGASRCCAWQAWPAQYPEYGRGGHGVGEFQAVQRAWGSGGQRGFPGVGCRGIAGQACQQSGGAAHKDLGTIILKV